jgi:hypothetical protein
MNLIQAWKLQVMDNKREQKTGTTMTITENFIKTTIISDHYTK